MEKEVFRIGDEPQLKASIHGSTPSPIVSIIIVILRWSSDLDKCFSSLATQTLSNFEVVVVVNGGPISVPKTENLELAQKVRFIFAGFNLGFGAACNLGAAAANGSVLLFLNPDTVLHPECLEHLYNSLSGRKPCIVQPLIHQGYVRSWMKGNPCDIYGATGNRFYGVGGGKFYASGAAIATTRTVFNSLGGFDEKLFLYHDDLDLCWRARLAGVRVSSVPQAICWHTGGQSSKSMPHATKFYYTQRNRVRVLIKNYSKQNLILRLPPAILFILVGSIFLSFSDRSSAHIRAALRALAWNLTVLRNTLTERGVTQRMRLLKDGLVEQAMNKYSMDIRALKQVILSGGSTQ
jgi:GT2 family glycosyltransferase